MFASHLSSFLRYVAITIYVQYHKKFKSATFHSAQRNSVKTFTLNFYCYPCKGSLHNSCDTMKHSERLKDYFRIITAFLLLCPRWSSREVHGRLPLVLWGRVWTRVLGHSFRGSIYCHTKTKLHKKKFLRDAPVRANLQLTWSGPRTVQRTLFLGNCLSKATTG